MISKTVSVAGLAVLGWVLGKTGIHAIPLTLMCVLGLGMVLTVCRLRSSGG